MAPMPAGGDDLPQSDEGLGTSLPPALTISSSDEDGDEEPAADAGYQPLPLAEPDDDVAGESDTEDENAADAAFASMEAFCRSATSNIVLQSSHLPPASVAANVDVKERAELWSKAHCSRTDSLPMDPDHAEKIRSVMSNISLPESCFPAWANVIPEDEWKAKLVSRISGIGDDNSDNVVGTLEADSSSSVTADSSTRHDIQDAS